MRLDHLPDKFLDKDGPGPLQNVRTALLLPLHPAQEAPPIGCVIAGITEQSLLDLTHRDFLDLLVTQLAQNIRLGHQFEETQKRAAPWRN